MSLIDERLKNFFYTKYPKMVVGPRNLFIDIALHPEKYTEDMCLYNTREAFGFSASDPGLKITWTNIKSDMEKIIAETEVPEEIINIRKTPDPPHKSMFFGLVGEFVDMWEPYTEADRAALAAQFLVAYGNAIGRGAYYVISGTTHHANQQIVLIGPSSYGAKGSGLDIVKETFRDLPMPVSFGQPGEVVATRVLNLRSGLTTGEGLIALVHDRKMGRDKAGKEIVVHDGVEDKRLLMVETEFGSVLRKSKRLGNTILVQLRQAWDGDVLETAPKGDPMRATNAHVSGIYHITPSEFMGQIDYGDVENGCFNRMLLVYSERSKLLADPEQPKDERMVVFKEKLAKAIQFGQQNVRMRQSDQAKKTWESMYAALTRSRTGRLHNSYCARGRAHVRRLSMVYALMDNSNVIERRHLEAAYAVWSYVESTSRYIFGDSLGDKTAEQILELLRAVGDQGLTTREITHQVGNKKGVPDALRLLAEGKQIRVDELKDTKSHRGQRWLIR